MTCSRTECGGRPEWHPVLIYRFPERFEPCRAVPAILGLTLCAACMDASTVSDFESEAIRQVVANLAAGMGWAKLDFSRTGLGRERLANTPPGFGSKTDGPNPPAAQSQKGGG